MQMSIDILISTMFRTNLNFLETMMANNAIDDFNYVIVNQTTEDKLLNSEKENITIINTYERGSPRSRNTAISNSKSEVCLMADDDVVYLPDLRDIIIEAHSEKINTDFITFEAVNEFGNKYTDYFAEGKHNKQSLKKIYTLVISFKRHSVIKNNIYFNHYFGIGSMFQGATEYVFLRNAFDSELKMYHKKTSIVKHDEDSSGRHMGSDKAIFAKSAMNYRFRGVASIFWLLKYIFFVWKCGYIKTNEIPHKLSLGIKGIIKYIELKKLNKIDLIFFDFDEKMKNL